MLTSKRRSKSEKRMERRIWKTGRCRGLCSVHRRRCRTVAGWQCCTWVFPCSEIIIELEMNSSLEKTSFLLLLLIYKTEDNSSRKYAFQQKYSRTTTWFTSVQDRNISRHCMSNGTQATMLKWWRHMLGFYSPDVEHCLPTYLILQ